MTEESNFEKRLTQEEFNHIFYDLDSFNVNAADTHLSLEKSIQLAEAVHDWEKKEKRVVNDWEGSIYAMGHHHDTEDWCNFIGILPIGIIAISRCKERNHFRGYYIDREVYGGVDIYRVAIRKNEFRLARYSYSEYPVYEIPEYKSKHGSNPPEERFQEIKKLYEKVKGGYEEKEREKQRKERERKKLEEQQKLDVILKSARDFLEKK